MLPWGLGGRRVLIDAAAHGGCAADEGDDEDENEDEDGACLRRWVQLWVRSYAVVAGLS